MTEPNPPAKRSSPLKPILWLLVLGGLGYGGWHWYQTHGAAAKGDAAGGRREPRAVAAGRGPPVR